MRMATLRTLDCQLEPLLGNCRWLILRWEKWITGDPLVQYPNRLGWLVASEWKERQLFLGCFCRHAMDDPTSCYGGLIGPAITG
jgi:hypothetical protein